MWFICVEVEQETSTPPPKKNPGSAPGTSHDVQSFAIGSFLECLVVKIANDYLC